ncbi:ABC transporter ATP-binding protein [Microbacterium rhizomatis]|uniref:ABC transporter ATP-binding protein n=2 Tax=Microbacterium rhizomatis TaxID=1631477 RepID=A0A5J5J570_9MICO|nr:ABC transporter ATP-binding protein [Microbacterium rhizomatis]
MKGAPKVGAVLAADVVVQRSGTYRLDAALRAEPGEVVAIMGPSGAGKSTLLGAIAGVVRLSAGTVQIGGEIVASPRRSVPPSRRGAVLLGQEPRLFPHMSARENVAFGLRARGARKEDAGSAADDWLWRVGLPGAGDHRPSELSGGQQQRVAVARALAVEPRVLLLDEPLTSLDSETAGEIRAMISEQLAQSRATVIMVTHDVIDATAMAHRLVVIEAGRVTQEGAVRDVLRSPATRFVASIAGVNRIEGRAAGGHWHTADAVPRVVIAGTASGASAEGMAESVAESIADGERLAAVFRPGAVRLEALPDASWTGALRLAADTPPAPGEWLARVVRLEQNLGGVRVHTAAPPVAVDIPVDEAAALRLATGTIVRLHVAAADVRLQPIPAASPPVEAAP